MSSSRRVVRWLIVGGACLGIGIALFINNAVRLAPLINVQNDLPDAVDLELENAALQMEVEVLERVLTTREEELEEAQDRLDQSRSQEEQAPIEQARLRLLPREEETGQPIESERILSIEDEALSNLQQQLAEEPEEVSFAEEVYETGVDLEAEYVSAEEASPPPRAVATQVVTTEPRSPSLISRFFGWVASPLRNSGSRPTSAATVEVFYATDRKGIYRNAVTQVYGADRGELVYGSATVSIPPNHLVGVIERPSIWRLERREDPSDHIVLVELKERDADSFFSAIQDQVSSSPRKNAFVYVHGYNVTFEAAARRTAQMAYDLGFRGAPIFYSWPSQGKRVPYTVDANNVQWTQEHLEQFLIDVADRVAADNIYLVGHSMGTQALTNAFANVVQRDSRLRARFKEIILAAPDIDADIFKSQIAPKMIDLDTHITLYASDSDRALLASKGVNGLPRAGDAGEGLVILNGIETVDASAVETDFTGHSYFAESVLSDIFYILRGNKADDRALLRRVNTDEGPYWAFREQER